MKTLPKAIVWDRSFHFRMDDPRYELLAREAAEIVNLDDQSIQRVLEAKAFPEGWETRLNYLRMKQRAAHVPDDTFYHPKKRKALGLKVRYGRRPAVVLGRVA